VDEQLVVSIVQWGKFQVEADGGDPQHGPTLRDKILPALNLINFAAANPKNFAQLCQGELGTVWSVGEKLAIFKSMTGDRDWRRYLVDRLQLNFVECRSRVTVRKWAQHSAQFTFQISRQATFLKPYFSGGGWLMNRCELRDRDGNVVIESGSFEDSGYVLDAETNYTFAVNFFNYSIEGETSFKTYQLPANTTVSTGWITVTFVSSTRFVGAHKIMLIFKEAFKYP
jgi:hypothetical protein